MTEAKLLGFDETAGRWNVGEEELHAGDVVEIEIDGLGWARARFEWSHRQGEHPQGIFLVGLPGDLDALVRLPIGARVRLSA